MESTSVAWSKRPVSAGPCLGSFGRYSGVVLSVLLVSLLLLLAPNLSGAATAQDDSGEYELPGVVLSGIPFSVEVETEDPVELSVGEESYTAEPEEGVATFEELAAPEGAGEVALELTQDGEVLAESATVVVPAWFSILPPVIAIGVALLFRQVIPALFLGIYVGAVMTYGLSLGALWYGLLDTLEVYALEALTDPGHAAIIIFTLMIGGMVGVISRNGGTRGIVNWIVRFASTPRRGQASTSLLGLTIFFDDYANTLVVGNTMRPISDRLSISREKLAYIVDSTAAPVATVALISTWVGFQVGLIGDAVSGIDDFGEAAYSIFLNSIPYSFYPLLAILFVFAVALMGRDFGPMYAAEQRARTTGEVLREGAEVDPAAADSDEMASKPDAPERAVNAILPIVVLIGTAIAGLFITGEGSTVRDIIGSSDSYVALTWASLLAVLVAVALSVGQRILSLGESMDAWYTGLRSMLFVMIILVMAWALSAVTDVLGTGDFLVSVLGGALPPAVVPALVFVVAAATAFSTGTSWGAMGILIPLTVPLTWAIMQENGLASPEYYYLMYASISTVLAGAVWGDHCSPISDTTIISSMASGCDHIDHVRTQLPYAMLVGLVAVVLGLLPVGLGVPWWVVLPLCAVVLLVVLRFFGKPLSEVPLREPQPAESGRPENVSQV